jgi:acyl-CoA dehydrogenase
VIFPLGRPYVVPSDRLGGQVADLLIAPSATRDRLTAGMYIPNDEEDPVGVLEPALLATIQAEEIEARIRSAQRAGKLTAATSQDLVAEAVRMGIIGAADSALLKRRDELRNKVIRVDDFPPDFGLQPVKSVDAMRRAA